MRGGARDEGTIVGRRGVESVSGVCCDAPDSVKALIPLLQTEQVNSSERLEMMFLNVSRAHFYGGPTVLPGHGQEGYCALLLNTVYGTKDAASAWQDAWSDHLKREVAHWKTPAQCCSLETVFVESATAMAVLQRDENWMSVAKFDVRRTGDIGYGDGCGMGMETLKWRVRLWTR